MRKNASFFSLIFHRFFEKNRRKFVQKAWKPALCTKIDEQARSERRFSAKNRFSANFWAPPGSPGPSRDDPENSSSIAPENEPGRPPGGLGKAPEVPPGALRVRFCVDFRIDFARQKQTKKHTKSVENNSKNLEELVTLIRATVNS